MKHIMHVWSQVDDYQLERAARVLIIIVAVEMFLAFTLTMLGVL